jgi:hypothetical protein|tara:strand:+ start:140 stop:640 length:501 start_codon:yes stop_codon:yes gene_type:complete
MVILQREDTVIKFFKMKQFLLLSTLFLTIFSCTVNEKPEFIALQNFEVIESTSKQITLQADALFNNPNDVGGTLETEGIAVLINGNDLAKVSSKAFKIPAKKDFTIPLTAMIPTDSLYSNTNLSGLLGSLLTKKMTVQFKGELKYKVFGFSHVYHVDDIQDVDLKF